jgi:hypothetical protein
MPEPSPFCASSLLIHGTHILNATCHLRGPSAPDYTWCSLRSQSQVPHAALHPISPSI